MTGQPRGAGGPPAAESAPFWVVSDRRVSFAVMPERAIPKPARSVRRALALGLLLLIPALGLLVLIPAPAQAQAQVPRADPAVGFWEEIPTPIALLVPVAAGLVVLIGVVLGPVGRPSPVFRREGGLSRALARRAPGGDT